MVFTTKLDKTEKLRVEVLPKPVSKWVLPPWVTVSPVAVIAGSISSQPVASMLAVPSPRRRVPRTERVDKEWEFVSTAPTDGPTVAKWSWVSSDSNMPPVSMEARMDGKSKVSLKQYKE